MLGGLCLSTMETSDCMVVKMDYARGLPTAAIDPVPPMGKLMSETCDIKIS